MNNYNLRKLIITLAAIITILVGIVGAVSWSVRQAEDSKLRDTALEIRIEETEKQLDRMKDMYNVLMEIRERITRIEEQINETH